MQGKVLGVLSAETGELVLYPREHPPLIKVSADVAALWHEVAVGLSSHRTLFRHCLHAMPCLVWLVSTMQC